MASEVKVMGERARFGGGLLRVLSWGLGGIRRRLRLGEHRWLREKSRRDRRFDRHNGVETAGYVAPSHLGLTDEQRDAAVTYIPIDPKEFFRGFEHLQIDYEKFTFVDLGSGKGRALMLASHFPFRKIVGVEVSSRLHQIAKRNLERLRTGGQTCSRIDLRCGDAAAFEFPVEPLLAFLYHPFVGALMKRVAARLRRSFEQHPRPVRVLYANPLCLEAWTSSGFTCVDQGDLFAILAPA